MLNILVTDDHPIFREGIKNFINKEVDLRVCCEAENGEETIKLISENNIDVVVLDVGLPGRSGLDILRDIKNIKPDLPVLVFSMYPEETHAIRAFKAGANGYLSKDSFANELIDAIRTVGENKKYITPLIAQKLAEEVSKTNHEYPHQNLSDRELEIAILIAKGKSIKEISGQLKLSPNTVNTYRKRILNKMSMKTNVELAVYAFKNHLISD